MSVIRGSGGGPTNSARWKNPLQTRRGRQALTAFEAESVEAVSPKFLQSHRDTEDLRYIAERYRRRKSSTRGFDNSVEFEMDPASGKIVVKIKDELTGNVQLKLSPEEVEKILKGLEETEDNDSSLTSFFIDVKV